MPSPTQNAFMDRMRQMMFRPIRNQAPEPVRPDYNESPSADEAVQIQVETDYSPFLFQNVNMAEIETRQIPFEMPEINWQRIAEQVQRREDRLGRGNAREGVDHAYDAWRYAQQAPQPSERSIIRERLISAAERLRSGVVSTPWHEAPEWLSHRKNELVELPYIMEYGSVCESLLRWEGSEYVVLPTISLKTGQVEYKKGSLEPQNGKERTECEEFAMKEIRKWAAENKTLAAMA